MDVTRILLLLIHISSAALLFGAGTGLNRNLKATALLGKEAFALALSDAQRRGKIMGVSSISTLTTGLILIFTIGGFAKAPLNFHIALALMLVAQVVSAVIFRPGLARLAGIVAAEPFDKEAVLPVTKKLAMGQGIMHLLWVSILVLMFVRIYK